jgi:DNA-binding response OmpR family regulator
MAAEYMLRVSWAKELPLSWNYLSGLPVGRVNEMKGPASGMKRILVVEDEPAIYQVCLRVLTREGFEVENAINGMVAEDKLRERDYDLVIIDIRTPVTNGKQLYQSIIKEYPKLTDRVIFTTGDVVDSYTQRFLELASRPFLPKPFTLDELRAIVRQTLDRLR